MQSRRVHGWKKTNALLASPTAGPRNPNRGRDSPTPAVCADDRVLIIHGQCLENPFGQVDRLVPCCYMNLSTTANGLGQEGECGSNSGADSSIKEVTLLALWNAAAQSENSPLDGFRLVF